MKSAAQMYARELEDRVINPRGTVEGRNEPCTDTRDTVLNGAAATSDRATVAKHML